ncbi:MAG: proline--tRNA ligase [Acidobacteria bacterium]|nr:proline--tRNA ligase [Acidobacteriota bacterium]
MRWSLHFIPTLREDPADAEVASHKLLLRAGYVRQLAAGVYSYLFLGQRSALKITQIIREEMNRIGAQEFFLPALNPAEIWQESGRWQTMSESMFQFKDHGGRDVCLGMTHEEVMTDIARRDLRSYKQLPQMWYQIQTKFRDEARPKSGLMRLRQFIMKDSYSFDIDDKGLDISYKLHDKAYRAIFKRTGLQFVAVQAHSGAMGGSESQEFMVISDAGEDQIVTCTACDYAANLEKAYSKLAPVEDPVGKLEPEVFDTPNVRTIAELAAFTRLGPEQFIKSLVYVADGNMVLALMRGDHELHESKLADVLRAKEIRPAQPDEIRDTFKASPGSIGPMAVLGVRLLADDALRGRRNLITGANQDDKHMRNVTPGEDFVAPSADLRVIKSGESCIKCGETLRVSKAIELGHIFKLGRRYAESMGAKVLDQDGKEVTLTMGSYGIGIERVLTAAIEQNHDADGMFLPRAIAPFDVVLTPTNLNDAPIREAADRLYAELQSAKIDVLYDDRDERPGVKFKDADLIGIPYRITVGKKVTDGKIELRTRSTGKVHDVSIGEVTAQLRGLLAE